MVAAGSRVLRRSLRAAFVRSPSVVGQDLAHEGVELRIAGVERLPLELGAKCLSEWRHKHVNIIIMIMKMKNSVELARMSRARLLPDHPLSAVQVSRVANPSRTVR